MSKDTNTKFVRLFEYLVSKDGKTKYLKLNSNPKADDTTKKLVAEFKKLIGDSVLLVNVFDQDFKDKHKIKDFVKGSVSIAVDDKGAPAATKSEVDF